ncbi:unnamed protein product [Bursaphelenchus okinawaensis]|uniref:BBS1 domain-containing protein n=1 Tax=Bursaphelenchus okinawaensis TaxID=465554 RepID=A0A811KCP1_9BILA|nr:unnamed protein product [Bursaphelenchus okinawaensis]CAG9098588.1 unnamed protein product [Bursaphelenchus okinawaensis]
MEEGTSSDYYAHSRSQKRWIRALYEPLAGVITNKDHVAIFDCRADGDYKLTLVNSKQLPAELMLYHGLTPDQKVDLSEPAAAICPFYSGQDKSPCVAIAMGDCIISYRNMKPYYKSKLSPEFLCPSEIMIWEAAKSNKSMTLDTVKDGIKECLKEVGMASLSTLSLQFLAQAQDSGRRSLLQRVRQNREPFSLTNVRLTCLASMKRHEQRPDGVDMLVTAAENGAVYFVETNAFMRLDTVKITQTPDVIRTVGLYDVEFRVFVVCREGDVVILKKSGANATTQSVFLVRSQPISLVYSVNQLVFSTRDHRLMFYSVRGRCLNELQLDDKISDIEAFHYEIRQYKGVLVAIGKQIRLYVEMFLVDVIRTDEPVSWMKFGKLGREEGVLLFGTISGGLYTKIFRRTATLEERALVLGPPVAQSQKLNVPKRTKAFIDQSLKERDNPLRIHKVYQRDLFMLKYNVTKAFASLQSGETGQVPSRDVEPVDVNVELLGFGPVFKIVVNISANKELPEARRVVSFVFDHKEYSIKTNMIILPDVFPVGVRMKFYTFFTCLYPEKQATSEVKVTMFREKWKQPIFSSTINVPISEPDIN